MTYLSFIPPLRAQYNCGHCCLLCCCRCCSSFCEEEDDSSKIVELIDGSRGARAPRQEVLVGLMSVRSLTRRRTGEILTAAL
jgi:hypothetical protein